MFLIKTPLILPILNSPILIKLFYLKVLVLFLLLTISIGKI